MAKQKEKIDKNQFIAAILNNPSLGKKDREKVLTLLTRDIEFEIKAGIRDLVREELSSATSAVKNAGDASERGHWEHAPRKVNSFLMSFSSDRSILKYAVHTWDAGEFDGFKYDSFVSGIRTTLKQNDEYSRMYWYNTALYYALNDYLLEYKKNPQSFHWDKDARIKIGLQYPSGFAMRWMKQNPGKQLWAMPLTAFPKDNQPEGLFDNKALVNMGDVCEVFKHVIEFRDDKKDFYKLIKTLFDKKSDFAAQLDSKELKGIKFYTYTTAVSNALNRVAENIRLRVTDTANTVRISIQEDNSESFELHIKHLGSFPDCSVKESKLYNGTFASMRCFQAKGGSLLSICDYSIIGRFKDEDGNLAPFRFDYLYPEVTADEAGTPKIKVEKLEKVVDGFEYIFIFYKNAPRNSDN